jgi:hypothetical protein
MQNSGRWMYMHGGQSSATIIEGFLMRDGNQGGSGGCLYLSNVSPIFRHCVFYSCTSGGGGGAVYKSGGAPQFFNCLLHGNSVTGGTTGGGGLACVGGSLTLRNCTFTENTSTYVGGGFSQIGAASTCNSYDSIFWGNTASVSGNEIYVATGHTCNLDYCDYGNGAGDIGGSINPTNCITSDPLLVTVSLERFLSHIAAGQGSDSPCIDAGSQSVTAAGLQTKTTRSDLYDDINTVDLGYHATGIGPPVSVITGAGFGNIGYLGGNIR